MGQNTTVMFSVSLSFIATNLLSELTNDSQGRVAESNVMYPYSIIVSTRFINANTKMEKQIILPLRHWAILNPTLPIE